VRAPLAPPLYVCVGVPYVIAQDDALVEDHVSPTA